ncbi:hypothetical protein EYF80_052101 [Liparis tanakae]|uniref:Uncharacterized protein n=1 Tax=Liparis tanakae TaxID=230148 RepID=A0A4Z2FAC9_9TELE|nr:hypothetical protein EYF80_052101 [Liparis tanakae]
MKNKIEKKTHLPSAAAQSDDTLSHPEAGATRSVVRVPPVLHVTLLADWNSVQVVRHRECVCAERSVWQGELGCAVWVDSSCEAVRPGSTFSSTRAVSREKRSGGESVSPQSASMLLRRTDVGRTRRGRRVSHCPTRSKALLEDVHKRGGKGAEYYGRIVGIVAPAV